MFSAGPGATGHKSIYIISVDPHMLRYHKNVISQLVARTPKSIARFKRVWVKIELFRG